MYGGRQKETYLYFKEGLLYIYIYIYIYMLLNKIFLHWALSLTDPNGV